MRCQRLNQDGKRCKREATRLVTMHQGEFTYDSEPRWCAVQVCKHHCDSTAYKIDEENNFPVDDKFALVLNSAPGDNNE